MSLIKLDKLFDEIIICHNNHYNNKKCDLIKVNQAPNENIIYHFYNDGEITNQKGGFAYKRRSEFTYKSKLLNNNNNLDLPIKLNNNISYAVLKKEECEYYYDKLKMIIENDN